jgi:prepilin-type N-terminal cleavage/methylation domain-containing protein
MNSLPSKSRRAAGFTLVEILVSIAVLGLMMVGVAQILSGTLSTSLGAYKHMDADTQARVVLDRMAFDIAHIVKRTDVDYFFQKNSYLAGGPNYGNDQMAFYSESGGYYPSGVTSSAGGGDVSLVGYMIAPMLNGVYNSTSGTPQLVRLSKGLALNGYSSSMPAMVFNPLAYAGTGTTTVSANGTGNTLLNTRWNGSANGIANGTDPNYQVIGDQIFRLEYTFLVQTSPTGVQTNGAQSVTYKTYTGSGFYDYPWSPTSTNQNPNGLKDVTAIVISIAVLDTKSRAILGSNVASALDTACSNLQDDTCTNGTTLATYASASTGFLPLTFWKNKLNSSTLGLPQEVAQQVRFYQRFCYLNHLQ